MSNDLGSQPAIVIFDKGRGEACGVAPVGVADPTFFAPITKVQREAGGVRGVTVNDAGGMVAPDGTVGGVPVGAVTDPVTGGIGIFGPEGKQIGGNGAPYAFTSRALTAADNGMTRVPATAQIATVNTGLPTGFACLFDGPISFNGTAAVADDRDVVTGKNNCVMYAIGTDAYRVVGKKGA